MKKFIQYLIVICGIALFIMNNVEAPATISYQENTAEQIIRIAFVGDSMLGRNVESLMERHGTEYPFASSSSLFDNTDLVVSNFEGAIGINHIKTKSNEMSFSFSGYVADVLQHGGIHIVSLANNHTFDKGAASYDHTINVLNAAGIDTFGHPLNASTTHVTRRNINNVQVAFIGFNSTFPSFDSLEAVTTVTSVKNDYPHDFIVVYMHWGNEYELESHVSQQEIASLLHDAGANIIIGAHPHVVQEVQCNGIDRCTIFSLGNFIFDQYFSPDVEQGLVAYLTIGSTGLKRIELIGIDGNHSKPVKMAENKDFFDKLFRRSYFENVTVSTSTDAIIITPQ